MAFLLFPTQLFPSLSHLQNDSIKQIYLIEEPRYFTDFKYHKLKLAYHRASMKKYYDTLVKKKLKVKYIDYDKVNNQFYQNIKQEYNIINIIFVSDHDLDTKLRKIFGTKLSIHENINMLIKSDELETIKKLIYKNNKYSHEEFYKYQRQKLDILVKSGKPIGGKWSFDTENRLPLPKDHKVPSIGKNINNKYIKEAKEYINKNFNKNYGSLDNFIYPIDSKSANKWLDKFLKQRLNNFGPYEDAVSISEPFIYHSVLSPMMNIGIITDEIIVNKSYKYYLKYKVNIKSFEGFIRQIIGWRNYVYTLYLLEGEELYNSNQLKHHNKLNDKFWKGTTNIKPIDDLINKIVKYAYVHHIERLMYLGNFMLLCLIDPKEVYRIFMEWTIDAYEWVMIPNIFGMSQYSSSIMMTRPYFSSSNYINKMSTYKRDKEWDIIWDALYYNFIDKHYDILKKNYAIAQQVKHWDNKSKNEQDEIKKIANKYIKELL
jgi:deoxyribodipyrimidine photolyase-related protein